jgi:hypothetical protein
LLTQADLAATVTGVTLVGFLGSIATIRNYPGATE